MIEKVKRFFSQAVHKYIYNYSIKRKLEISYISIITVPILVIGISASYISRIYMQKAEMKNHFNSIATLNSVIDFNFEIHSRRSETIFCSSIIQDMLSRDNNNIEELMKTYNTICDFIVSIINEFNYPSFGDYKSKYLFEQSKISIYPVNKTLVPDGEYIRSYDSIKDSDWCKDIVNNNELKWTFVQGNGAKDMIRLSRKLVNFKNQDFIGILCIEIPVSRICTLIIDHYNYPGAFVVYYNNNKDVVASTGKIPDELMQPIKEMNYIFQGDKGVRNIYLDNGEYIISYNTSSVTGWKVVSLIPSRYILESSKKIKNIMYVTILISTLLCLMVTFLTSSALSARFKRLIGKIRSVEKDYYKELVELGGEDEIGELDVAFNHMIEEIKRLINVEYKSRIIRDTARLELLQEQINPHLLYNTLSTIGWRAKKSGSKEISEITDSLIRFYRTSLNRGDIIIKMQQEIDMTIKYIDIMQYTYNLDFKRYIDIDTQVYGYYTMKLILQPIVENALFHGIRNIDYQGILTVTGRYVEGELMFEICDNGIGMSQETVDRLMSCDRDGTEKGYGVSSVIRRLHLFFGEEYGISIKSQPHNGTIVKVRIPAFNEEELKQFLSDKYLL